MALHDPTHLYEGEVSPRAEGFAKIVSAVSYAPFVSAVLFPLLNITSGDATTAIVATIVTFLTATLLPVLIVQHYSVKSGNTDGDVVRREDRGPPLIGGIVCYIIGTVLLWLIDAPRISTVSMLCYAVITVLILLVTTRWKISIHSTGLMGPGVALTIVYPPWGLIVFLLLPVVMWSRYVRRKHTPAQLIGGAVLGFSMVVLIFGLLL